MARLIFYPLIVSAWQSIQPRSTKTLSLGGFGLTLIMSLMKHAFINKTDSLILN